MLKQQSILIVDDIASNIQTLAGVLKDEYMLKVATSGERALEIMEAEDNISLVLLDVKMPQMDGYEVLEKLQSNPKTKDIPVIFVTGNDSVADEEKGLLSGAVDYITKPIRPAIVKARVKIHMTLKLQKDELFYNSIHDTLTGLYNRKHLESEGSRKFSLASRTKAKLSVIMLDIDHFKAVNDTYGHLTGDKVLQAVSAVLSTSNRNEDFCARFGGEEFVILLEDCDASAAIKKAEGYRVAIEESQPEGIVVTSSFGVVSLGQRHKTLEDFIKDADTALYEAKDTGRNKVVLFKGEAL